MDRVSLEANIRQETGKTGARRVRKGGRIPAIVYGRGRTSLAVAVASRTLRETLHTHAGLNVLIDLGIRADSSEDKQLVIIKDLQQDIFTHEIIHVDFQAISLEERLEAHVPVVLLGTPKGVVDGGVLEQHLREVLVECLPTQIPEHVEVDVAELTVGHALHAGDLAIPAGVTLLTPPGEVVATVQAPRAEEAPPAAAAPEAVPTEAVEGAPAPDEKAPEAAKKAPEEGE